MGKGKDILTCRKCKRILAIKAMDSGEPDTYYLASDPCGCREYE